MMVGGYFSWTEMNQCYNCIHCIIIKASYNLWSTSIRHWPDTFETDQCLINVNLGQNWHIIFMYPHIIACDGCLFPLLIIFPDSKVHGANMGPIWAQQDPGGPHVGPMNFAIWVPLPQLPLQLHSFILLDAADRDPYFNNRQCNQPVHMKYKNNVNISFMIVYVIMITYALIHRART